MKSFSLLFLFVVSAQLISAQTVALRGKVLSDKDSSALIGANILLVHLPDSTQMGTTANPKGVFVFPTLDTGYYKIRVSYVGHITQWEDVHYTGTLIQLKTFRLVEGQDLDEFVVEEQLVTATQSGDTASFNAGAFKVNQDANAEDLITKMPGVVVQNGQVQVQGENVTKVMVDGKPFMGDDPKSALKNLPANAISKVQVYDQKSDQATFTGVDDGNTTKTINIVTKPEFRNGTFGKYYGGYGTKERYNAGGSFNSIKDQKRFTIIGQSNSINEQNFASEDLSGVLSSSASGGGSGGHRRGGRGGYGSSNADDFYIDQSAGINTTHALGINFTNAWKNKFDFTGSYFFNYSDNKTISNLHRQYVLASDSGLVYNEDSKSTSSNMNHRVNFRFTWQIDSLKSILFKPKGSYQSTRGQKDFYGINTQSDFLVSNTTNGNENSYSGLNFTAPLLYRQKLKKQGRTFSVEVEPGYNFGDGKNEMQSINYYYTDTITNQINQYSKLQQTGFTWASSLNYTEGIGKTGLLELEYETDYNGNNSDKKTYQRNPSTQDYSDIDTALSNSFVSDYFSQRFGSTYRINTEKLTLAMGLQYQTANLNNDQEFPLNPPLHRTFNALLPSGMLMYKFSKTKNIRLYFRARTSAPSVRQLQEVIDNTNTLQLTTGNSALVQDYRYGLFTRYLATNTEKSTSFFVMFGGSYTLDYIGNSTFIAQSDSLINGTILLQKGSQISRPVNIDGYYSLRTYSNYSFTIPKLKSNMNVGLSGTYSRTPGYINESLNYSNSTNFGVNVSLSSNISEKIDFTISTYGSYSIIENTLQKELNSTYFNQNSKFKITANVWKGLFLQSDINHQFFGGLSSGYNTNFFLWSGAVAYKFLKNKSGDIRISVFDALEQNTSVARNVTDVSIEDQFTNVLDRYYLLTFTYTFRNFAETKIPKEPKH